MPLPYGSVVVLFGEVPLDPMYEHTILFNSIPEQRAYFETKKITQTTNYSNLSYIRHQGGSIRLESDMSLLTNCNYIQFYNPLAYEDVSFYCFVTNIQYINEHTVQIDYMIDQIQTWWPYYDLNPCYVEREHVRNDAVGANRVNEGLDTGPYICPAIERIDHWDSVYSDELGDSIQNTTFVVVATQAPDGTQSSYQFNGIASSMYVTFAYTVGGLQNILDSFNNGVTHSLEPIVSIGMFPSYFKPNASSPINPATNSLTLDQAVGFGGFMAYDPESVSVKTYVPKNNKLYQYPYNYMVFEAPDGSTTELRFEDFKNNNVHQFVTWLSVLPEVETMCAPCDYEGPNNSFGSTGMNLRYALYSKAYPYCAVASDAFSAWWAQNKYSMPVAGAIMAASSDVKSSAAIGGTTTSGSHGGSHSSGSFADTPENRLNKAYMMQVEASRAASNGGGLAAAKYLENTGLSGALIMGGRGANMLGSILNGSWGSIGNAAVEIGRDLAAIEGHKAVPDTLVTKANNGGVNHYMEMDCYKIQYIKIRPEYAEIIDNYFSCFGYAIRKVKVPDITSRTQWNYIKTKGCTIKKNAENNKAVPMEAEREICAIFDKGITFWHNPYNIHNYNLNNPIVE